MPRNPCDFAVVDDASRVATVSPSHPRVTVVGDLLGPSIRGLDRWLQIPTGWGPILGWMDMDGLLVGGLEHLLFSPIGGN